MRLVGILPSHGSPNRTAQTEWLKVLSSRAHARHPARVQQLRPHRNIGGGSNRTGDESQCSRTQGGLGYRVTALTVTPVSQSSDCIAMHTAAPGWHGPRVRELAAATLLEPRVLIYRLTITGLV